MAKKSVSEFFKNMFRRRTSPAEVGGNSCRICDCTLEPESMGPRVLERCPQCRGIWLSQAQLTEILSHVTQHLSPDSPENKDAATIDSDGEASIGHTFAPSRKPRSCPQCAADMENYRFEETGIWIDGCPESHGIWLDEGELRLIAERSKAKQFDDAPETGSVMDAVADVLLGSL